VFTAESAENYTFFVSAISAVRKKLFKLIGYNWLLCDLCQLRGEFFSYVEVQDIVLNRYVTLAPPLPDLL